MKLSEFKSALHETDKLQFQLENGERVPAHFHVTEIGRIDKKFMDCGGVLREETTISLQLWTSVDLHHRLKPSKLVRIVEMSEEKLSLEDSEIEVEYQAQTIGKYGLEFNNGVFVLTGKKTDCLAKEDCGVPAINLIQVAGDKVKSAVGGSCTPGGGCC